MKPLKLFMNTVPGELPENTYPYGKNGIQFDLRQAIFNEPGFALMAAAVPYTLIGVIETDSKPVLMSTNNVDSAIGFFNPLTGLYEAIVDDRPAALVNWPNNGERLGFTLDHYITGEAQRNYKAEIVISFTDKDKFPKYLNCDNPSVSRLDDMRLFPYYTPPRIALSQGSGGSLPAGAYYVAIAYERNDGTSTPYSEVSSVEIVRPGGIGTLSDKALFIALTAADQSYDFVRVAIISKVDGKISAVELSDWTPITTGTINIIYTGDNISSPITVQEILTPPAIYERVGTMGQLNDALYIGNLDKELELVTGLQQYVNMATVRWKSELIDATSPPPEHVQGSKRGFMHEEVYALYIRFHKTRGGFTKSFHLPGLPLLAPFTGNSTEAVIGGETTAVPRYKVEDCIPFFDPVGKTGSCGAWLNSTEVYPNDPEFDSSLVGGTDLRGLPVRHHKMPSLRWCKNNLYASVPEYGKTKLDILTLEITALTLPAAYSALIDGYEILYAKRTGGNMTVLGQGALLHGAVPATQTGVPTGNADIFTTGGNWTSSVTHAGKGDYDDDWELTQLRLDTMRLHPFDMLLNKPTAEASFISAQYKMRRNELKTAGYLEDGAHNDAHNMPTIHLVDYTLGVSPTAITTGKQLRKVKSGFYLSIGITINKFNNVRHENTYAGTLGGSNWALSAGDMSYRIRGGDQTEPALISDYEETYLVNLISLKQDMYSAFYSQRLVSAGMFKAMNDFSAFQGGDTFVCDYTFHTYGRHDQIDTQGEGYKGKKVIRRLVCESASNIHLRYEIPGNVYSKWYPHNSVAFHNPDQTYPAYWDRSVDPNQFGYSRDLNALNDFISSSIFNPFAEYITRFPYRIHRLGKLSRQSKPRSWRTALPLDYYECQKNMGVITNIAGMYDRLLIHHENALFVTQDKAKLEAGLLSVTLGTGDIFQFEPQEAQPSKLGYAGSIHDLASIKTPMGYLFVDGKQGEIFLWSGDKPVNIGADVSNFLRDNMKIQEKNVYVGNGITVGYDQKYKRFLLTVKNDTAEDPLEIKMFEDTDAFFNALQVGDIVNYYGRLIEYKGINDPEESGFECEDDEEDPDVFGWEIDTFICEQEEGPIQLAPLDDMTPFNNLSSPAVLLYDGPSSKMYVGDHDKASGNFYSLDLETGDKEYFGTSSTIYSLVKDALNRRIFGSSLADGLKVFNVDDETVETVAYGSNVAQSRTGLWIIGNNIVARDIDDGTLTIIDRETLNIIAVLTISTDIPSGSTWLIESFDLLYVNGNVWVIPKSRSTDDIAVYSEDFSTLIDTFALTGNAIVADWGTNDYIQNAFYDVENGRVYIHDVGSAKTFAIDAIDFSILHTYDWTKNTEHSVLISFYQDPVTGDLYMYRNNVTLDGTTQVSEKVYIVDRTGETLTETFSGADIEGELVREGATDYMWVAVPGAKSWEGGSWATDGSIKRFAHGIEITPP